MSELQRFEKDLAVASEEQTLYVEEKEQLITRKEEETRTSAESGRTQLQEALTKVHELSELRVTLEAEVSDLTAKVTELEARAITSRDGWNTAKDTLFEVERRMDRAKSAFDLLREQVALDLHAGIDALNEVEPPADEESRNALESEVAKLADQIEKIGPVNVLAIEEHQELETRESFLRTQRDDLVQAIDSLRGTIRKINLTSRELFREAFSFVNQQFGEIFTSLFGGGTARMQLLDEEDVLESGIELLAQPPGKKNNSIALAMPGGSWASRPRVSLELKMT
jgi:chromosome segregation protein